MEQTGRWPDVRAYIIRTTTDAGSKVGAWTGLLAGTVIGGSLRTMMIGSVVGSAIGWVVGKYNSRLL